MRPGRHNELLPWRLASAIQMEDKDASLRLPKDNSFVLGGIKVYQRFVTSAIDSF